MAPTTDSIAQVVERFIRSRFRVSAADGSFHRDVHLYDSGFVDSIGVIELIAFLESTFGVELQEESLFSDDFTTIAGISGVVQECLRQKVAVHDLTEAIRT
jgi:acyl carrier protein